MANTGYKFFIDHLECPYAPSELTVTIGSNNKTVDLINGNPINILKSPKLTGFKFEIELPRGRQYPFANTVVEPSIYTDYFKKVMLNKTPVHLVITRPNPFYGSLSAKLYQKVPQFESTDIMVSLEGYEMEESADNAYDVKVALTFTEYIEYGTVKTKVDKPVVETEPKETTSSTKYTVQKGDCLWKISRKFYGTGNKWETIYYANKDIIEKTAEKYGKASSSKGHWIYPGCVLVIPATKPVAKKGTVKDTKAATITTRAY